MTWTAETWALAPSLLQRLEWCERAPHWSARVREHVARGGARERGRLAHARLGEMGRAELEEALGVELTRWEVEREVRCTRWEGRVDLLAVTTEGEWLPVELKSTSRTRRDADAMQLLAYAEGLEQDRHAPISRGLVWYVRQEEVWEVTFDAQRRAELTRWRDRLEAATASPLPPAVTSTPGACSMCPYTGYCADDPHSEEVEPRATVHMEFL